MLNRFFITVLFVMCGVCSTQVYAAAPAKASNAQAIETLQKENRKLKRKIKQLQGEFARFLSLFRSMKVQLSRLSLAKKALTNVNKKLGIYYKQWYYLEEKLTPPIFQKTRIPFIKNWLATKRKLSFVKRSSTSILRITYNDNLGAINDYKHKNSKKMIKKQGDASCVYSIFIDKKPCVVPTPIEGSVYMHRVNIHNPFRQRSIIGFCSTKGWTKELSSPIKKGRHEVQVYVRITNPSYHGVICRLGWQSTTSLMIEEIEPPKKRKK